MLAIIFDQSITARDVVKRPVLRDHLLVSPELVLLDGVENAVFLGLLWVQPWRILGTTALARVSATGLEVSKKLEGKKVLVFPFSNSYGGLGTDIDGVMAEEALVPSDVVVEVPDSADWKYLLYPHLSLIEQIISEVRDSKVLIVGGGLTGMLAAALLPDVASKVGLFTEGSVPLTLEGVEKVGQISGDWDAILLSSMKSWIRGSLSALDAPRVILPRFSRTWPLNLFKNTLEIFPKPSTYVSHLLGSKRIAKVLESVVGFSDDVLASIPTSKPAVVVEFKRALYKLGGL
ncbi:alcohol dehydrogenase [Sulfodiicoccus acidiphilus]|uniref:Alcohol dehydrogenase n=1 Tax=Sulfodiicoccus acidiphilus TaxID=1670455 RepID=A0A348B6U5_9CREN|nr:hypothetical protein [Sulfodiicoccus acidiphilus]BBD73897.1 alcohol dehydrogenase [Sulfodiicoccus acidiphilus]GGT96020.1 alcohol dehydrogenase [Sulfodiicoccus acidiphilus]